MSRFEWNNIRLVLLLLLMLINSIPIGYAEEEPITIFLDCYKPCKDEVVNYSEIILFNLTIKNNLDEWVELQGSSNLQITVSSDRLPNINGKESDTHYIFQSSFLIEPKSEINVYFPFNIYNNLYEDIRISDWNILPRLSVNTIISHSNPFELKGRTYYNQRSSTNYITGNPLQFKAEKPEPSNEVQKTNSSNLEPNDSLPTTIFNFINSNIISTILGGLFVGLVLKKYFDKGKKKK